MPNDTLEQRRAKIKYWLDVHNISRQEVAEKLGVHISSLNGWLSNKHIPEKRWQDIESLFKPKTEEPPPQQQGGKFRAVGLLFTAEQLEEIKAIAGDTPIEDFIREATLSLARKILKNE